MKHRFTISIKKEKMIFTQNIFYSSNSIGIELAIVPAEFSNSLISSRFIPRSLPDCRLCPHVPDRTSPALGMYYGGPFMSKCIL